MSLLEFPLEQGGTVVVEVSEVGRSDGAGPVYRGGPVTALPERAGETLQGALARIQPAAQAVVDTILRLPRRPDEVCVSFGIELSGSVGAVIAATAAKANFSVTLTWKATADRSGGS